MMPYQTHKSLIPGPPCFERGAKVRFLFAFFLLSLPSFYGCFETQFDFKTIVRHDGFLIRDTRIEGHGASFFKIPGGKGWTSKMWKTEGETALLPDVEYHVQAHGEFPPHQAIPSDFQLDLSQQMEKWEEKVKKGLEELGIEPPYEENLYSRNRVRVHQLKGWLTNTYVYEETFENKGILTLLLRDLKEEIKKQSAARGEVFKAGEIDDLARIRLEEEILPEIRFTSEVSMPGKILTSNAHRMEKGKALWKFSLKDFQEGHSVYTLRVVSRSLRWTGAFFLLLALGILCAVLLVMGVGAVQIRRRGNRRGNRRKKNLEDHPSDLGR